MPYFKRKPGLTGFVLLACALTLACGKSGESSGAKTGMGGGGSGGSGGTGGKPSGPVGLPMVPGQPDTSVKTALPPIPSLVAVTASAVGDSVSITVEPFAGARDYRVYELPADDNVIPGADGQLTVTNAVYRCAGDRQAAPATVENAAFLQRETVRTLVDNATVHGVTRSLDEAVLGYIYVLPGADRVPVYALGEPSDSGDNLCFHQRWNESRVKKYTTSDTERADLIAKGWRDDGIVFYAPKAGPKTVYIEESDSLLYFTDGPEKAKRNNPRVAFTALDALDGADSTPLMRVNYQGGCSNDHDELVAGPSRFERARIQGDKQPLWDLHWSGIKPNTVLVVEALDQGCPYQPDITSASRDGGVDDGVDYPPFTTLADAQAASPTGEVFINGHHDSKNKPKPLARSFIKVSPSEIPEMDWFAGFGPDEVVPDFNALGFDYPCELPGNEQCFKEYRQKTDYGDVSFNASTLSRDTLGVVMGELVLTYADVGSDVGGHFRFTPSTKGKMSPDSYLHVTMEVDIYSTTRRYPQLIISDGDVPIQANFKTSNTIIYQPFPDHGSTNWPFVNAVEVCDHRDWEVNNQCPMVLLGVRKTGDKTTTLPIPEVSEHSGLDRSTRIDVFTSTKRIYLFTDGKAGGCIDLPSTGVPNGDVTITFGDALYHSGADDVHTYNKTYQMFHSHRHFDNLGFKSGAPAPAWDDVALPCVSWAQAE